MADLALAPLSVTAVVVAHDHARCIGRCLETLRASRGLAELQIICVDNASRDRSAAVCADHGDAVSLIRNRTNEGFACAVNQGLARARGRYTALVNPDIAMPPDTLARLVDTLRASSRIGLIGPELRDEQGRRQPSLAHYPTVAGLARRGLSLDPTGRSGWLVGAFVVARTALLRRLGGLAEGYFVYGEDMDLSHRVQQLGLEVAVTADIPVTHTGNPHWSLDRLVRIYSAYVRFISMHHPRQRRALAPLVGALWLARGVRRGARLRDLRRGLEVIGDQRPDPPPGALW